ncbi:uncharacterized protein K452DRAFT_38733 [Aplosporella prunicola CBS 121167]|uniref:Uncharacterized protein n=1 Tax=Aplosporella prunicola CBS 121167 TaxID=1176127 RepID=A0A6A6BEN4_9PEZI|nr:uncharacterized protein K452DRAFT_38733 [Aplosporella prunicola CBS 121167]KAF2141387.1 hypothetical protein K452DRAFT_38733 [Aplosporella prunicola CBS 121167]
MHAPVAHHSSDFLTVSLRPRVRRRTHMYMYIHTHTYKQLITPPNAHSPTSHKQPTNQAIKQDSMHFVAPVMAKRRDPKETKILKRRIRSLGWLAGATDSRGGGYPSYYTCAALAVQRFMSYECRRPGRHHHIRGMQQKVTNPPSSSRVFVATWSRQKKEKKRKKASPALRLPSFLPPS